MVILLSHSPRMSASGSWHMVGRLFPLKTATGNVLLHRLRPLANHSRSDLDGMYNAIAAARREKSKPTLIKLRTTIGYGSKQQGTHGVHGSRA